MNTAKKFAAVKIFNTNESDPKAGQSSAKTHKTTAARVFMRVLRKELPLHRLSSVCYSRTSATDDILQEALAESQLSLLGMLTSPSARCTCTALPHIREREVTCSYPSKSLQMELC